ncbi:MAG: histidine kinase, partial [Microbacterium sp.]
MNPADLDLVLPRSRRGRWFTAHPRVLDVLVIAVYLVPMLYGLSFEYGDLLRGLVSFAGLCTVGAAVALWWRRSHPLLVLIVAVALGSLNTLYLNSSAGVAVVESMLTVYAVASRRRTSIAFLGLALSLAIPTAVIVMDQLWDWTRRDWQVGLQPLVLVAFALGLTVRAAGQRRLAQEQLIAARVERAARDERARITAEMHDVVAHSVTVMIALAGGARTGWQKHPERARQALDQLEDVGAQALADMQRILHVLRADESDAGDLRDSGHDLPTLDELVEPFRTAGLPVLLEVVGDLPDDPALRTTVYRIVQEGLTNALRHAPSASRVWVRVDVGEDAVAVTVQDDGAAARGRSTGPAGMSSGAGQERPAIDAGPSGAGQS